MTTERISFSKISSIVTPPDLLNIQKEAFEEFLQLNVPPEKRENKGLQAVFLQNFPITDTKETLRLDFVEYYVDKPRYTMQECEERGLSYTVPLKAKLRLSQKDEITGEFINSVEKEVFLGNMPFMTPKGAFIINGAQRVIVNQLHRSPGVVYSQAVHANGTPLYGAKIVPFKGSWVEFVTDINNCILVYVDRKKKFLSTTLLRALGYSNDEDILNLFGLVEKVSSRELDDEQLLNRRIAEDIFNPSTGEIIVAKDSVIDDKILDILFDNGVDEILLYKADINFERNLIINTLRKDTAFSREDALFHIYRQLRTGEAPDIETAQGLLDKLFFDPRRYDLGEVGRFRMNKRLGLDIPIDKTVLTNEDIVTIMKLLIDLSDGAFEVDDIDHLGNRRVRTVGEQLAAQYNSALARMARTIRDKLNMRDSENFQPQELVNSRTITSVINSFFGTNQLSQFMDQTNPLAELTHKRRVSALGPGGLSRDRAGFEARDVHHSHYGRLCPIETPEGPNIGLISSLTIYLRVNSYGFIETPYRVIEKGKVTDKVEYIAADQEDNYTIAQSTINYDKKTGKILEERIQCRKKGEYIVISPDHADYMDVAPQQIVSAGAALIPFLEHDDANRALMGSNMQRQAVPLLNPEAPLVGTGLEKKIAIDSRTVIVAEGDGVVDYVDAEQIIIRYDEALDEYSLFNDNKKTYKLLIFIGTNQETSINQRPLVKKGERVTKGQAIADGQSTDHGELALGRNVLVAFMPWRGYNFEDAIILNERVVKEDIFTSIHIEEVQLDVRATKRGGEEFTKDIPNISDVSTKDLDENGIIRKGAEVREGDILIGKVTPKGESEPTPQEKLLRAIFGEKAGNIKDASKYAAPGLKGVVVKSRLFSKKRRESPEYKKAEKHKLDALDKAYGKQLADAKQKFIELANKILVGNKVIGAYYTDGSVAIKSGTKITADTLSNLEHLEKLDFRKDWLEDAELNQKFLNLGRAYLSYLADIENNYEKEKIKIQSGEELQPGILQLAKVYIAKKRKIQVGDKMAGRHGNKGVVSKIVPQEDMPYLEDGTPVDIILNPLGVPSRMNVGQLFETALGWAGKKLGVKFATPIFDGASNEDVSEWMRKAGLPESSKVTLYDGRTGEKMDQKVFCGYIYMMKLNHMVDDKIHARSIGHYSLITLQPLGGKAQFGGQRFGEMEVWALEAYGASHILQEILTIKSDDIIGRAKSYEAIVKGDNIPDPNIPEAFKVLLKELMGLCLNIKINVEEK
ncbi:MAG TPA: DNA-directed RNA polymerase subunit beta [Ignavibacteriales bacterium]|nr:DNA-directed RNA polymerase subunit beta [Ignavibacteriales bacterium]